MVFRPFWPTAEAELEQPSSETKIPTMTPEVGWDLILILHNSSAEA
jgi:hypothetical protein